MPLVVPVLRLAYVFLNVFETFKTLRLPPPSARNGGQPSARAMSARKRAMKGCMTVWLVWVCFTVYERWVETFVWLFVPFYSEIKSLFILFFLLTRAKGAEPIYLHVLRPLIKPYTVPLDALFDALASFGDLIFLVALIPVNYVRGYYRRWRSAYDPPQADVQTWHQDDAPTEVRPSAHRQYVSESNDLTRPAAVRDVSTGSVRQTRSTTNRRSGVDGPAQQIWHPPASAYDVDVALNPHSGLPTPPIEKQKQRLAAERQSSIVAPKPVRPSQFTGIVEEDTPAGPPASVRPGFRKSLQLPREPRNPGSEGDLSDKTKKKGVQQPRPVPNIQINNDDDGLDGSTAVETETYVEEGSEVESDLDDDVFSTTLRTPYTRRDRDRGADSDGDESYLDDLMLTPPPMRTAFSLDSAASRSTAALSTTDNGSSLRTRSTASDDGASSLAAKRPRQPPRYAEDDARFSLGVPPRSKAAAAGKGGNARAAGPGSGTIGRKNGKALQAAASALDSEEEDDGDRDGDDGVPSDAEEEEAVEAPKAPKAQRAAVRQPPKRGDSQGTVRGPLAVKPKAGAGSNGAANGAAKVTVRPASTRIAAAAAGAKKERPPLATKKSGGSGASSVTSTERKVGVGAKGTVRAKAK